MPAAFVLALLIIQSVTVLVYLSVSGMIAAAFGIHGAGFQLVSLLLSLTFTSASVLVHWFRGKVLDWYYTGAAYLFGLMYFLFGGALLAFFVAHILYNSSRYIPLPVIAIPLIALFFLLHLYGTVMSGRIRITRLAAVLPGLPAAWRGKKVVFVSDLHLGNVRGAPFAARVAERILALKPEIVIIGGDLYDGGACDAKAVIAPLSPLVPASPHGVYFVTGNHEYFLRDLQGALEAIRGLGIRILDNETVSVNGLNFIGVDDKATHAREGFRATLAKIGVDRRAPNMLIKHEPNDLAVACDAGVAFGLFGHTHHGQIWPLNFFTRQLYRGFDYGFKRLGDMQVMVSSGVGTWGPPLRLGTKSEIVLLELA